MWVAGGGDTKISKNIHQKYRRETGREKNRRRKNRRTPEERNERRNEKGSIVSSKTSDLIEELRPSGASGIGKDDRTILGENKWKEIDKIKNP